MTYNDEIAGSEAKQEWVRPELQRIAAGSAESAEGDAGDGVIGQGS